MFRLSKLTGYLARAWDRVTFDWGKIPNDRAWYMKTILDRRPGGPVDIEKAYEIWRVETKKYARVHGLSLQRAYEEFSLSEWERELEKSIPTPENP